MSFGDYSRINFVRIVMAAMPDRSSPTSRRAAT
jgi:hypothetical protein